MGRQNPTMGMGMGMGMATTVSGPKMGEPVALPMQNRRQLAEKPTTPAKEDTKDAETSSRSGYGGK